MVNKSKVLFIVLLSFLTLSAAATFYQYYVLENYVIAAEVECDPESEACFLWICDPAIDGEEYCTGDMTEDTWYYKLIYREARNTPYCEPYAENCDALECREGEENCEIVSCTPEIVAEEELDFDCTDPETFVWPDYFLEDEEEMEPESAEEIGVGPEENQETEEDLEEGEAPEVPDAVDN